MAEQTLIAKVREDTEQEGTLIILSPVVGMADGAPRVRVFLNPLDRVVPVKILGKRFALRLPRDCQGRVTEVFIPNEYGPIAYGQPLARLDPRASEAAAEGGPSAVGTDTSEGGANLLTIPSPSEGIFYRRPAPDAPPFVEEGAEVHEGSVLGLVEVMKCFNQITYGGPEFPDKAKMVKILADDAEEVAFGQPLYRVEPLD